MCEGREKYVYIKGDKKKTCGEWRQRIFTFTSESPREYDPDVKTHQPRQGKGKRKTMKEGKGNTHHETELRENRAREKKKPKGILQERYIEKKKGK